MAKKVKFIRAAAEAYAIEHGIVKKPGKLKDKELIAKLEAWLKKYVKKYEAEDSKKKEKIDAENKQLNHACAKLDCRKKCCFGFLPRSHKLNRFFGRLFRRPGPALTVHALLY